MAQHRMTMADTQKSTREVDLDNIIDRLLEGTLPSARSLSSLSCSRSLVLHAY